MELAILIIVFFVTTAIGVVTGSNSLITVPVMFQFGIDPRVAVATNMFGLTFMSIGASIPFFREGLFDRKRLPILLPLTLIGSAIGAFLVGIISSTTMPKIVSVSMLAACLMLVFRPETNKIKSSPTTNSARILVYVLAFLLAIYGGLYSGGYVTALTTVFVTLFGMTFSEAVANTKIINVFSSAIATLIFAWQGLIDYRLGIILGVTMFIAAYVGAKFATRMSEIWLRRIFLTAVIILAIKTLLDVF